MLTAKGISKSIEFCVQMLKDSELVIALCLVEGNFAGNNR